MRSVMYTETILTTALFAATSVTADQVCHLARSPEQDLISYLTPNQFAKLDKDAKSLALENTAAANALYSFQETQTAVPLKAIASQDDQYLNAFVTATTAPLPAYISALPTSLQPYASSIFIGDGSIVRTDVAPAMSSEMAAASSSSYVVGGTGTGSVNADSPSSTIMSTYIATIVTSGIPRNSANATVSKTSTTAGSPTTPPAPPKPTASSGAGKTGAFVAAGMVGFGLAGLMSLL